MGSDSTTTVQVTREVHRGLDIRKEPGETIDDVIRRLMAQTPAPLGSIKEDDGIEHHEWERADDAPFGASCSHYDVIAGEVCGDPAEWIQTVAYDGGDEQQLYFCEAHGPEGSDGGGSV
jgi:hypothetical protein